MRPQEQQQLLLLPQQRSALLVAALVLLSNSTMSLAFTIIAPQALLLLLHGKKTTPTTTTSTTALGMGLFDGVKEAFGAPALERSAIDAERETPIDRWMGWSVTSEEKQRSSAAKTPDADFVDAMDESNYVSVELTKPMGIVFEENDADYGGIYVQSLKPDGAAAANGALQVGDQLVAVNAMKVSGRPFDEALGTIVDAPGEATQLLLFRGAAKQFYGPAGVGKEWLDEFIAKGGKIAAQTSVEEAVVNEKEEGAAQTSVEEAVNAKEKEEEEEEEATTKEE